MPVPVPVPRRAVLAAAAALPLTALAPRRAAAASSPVPAGYPDARTTGYAAGGHRALRVHRGPLKVTRAGTRLEGLHITGPLWIGAPGVSVTGCLVSSAEAGPVVWVRQGGAATLTHCTILGSGRAPQVGLRGEHWTATGCDISGVGDGVYLFGDVTLRGSYVHDLNANGQHHDCLQGLPGGGTALVDGCTLVCSVAGGRTGNSVLHVGNTGLDSLTVRRSFLDGGGVAIQAGLGGRGARLSPPRRMTVADNLFGSASRRRPTDIPAPQPRWLSWTGNRVETGSGRSVPAPFPG